ncbi:MAG TPA: gamma-glutamyltransferase [Thermomicrobiales bacterium]|nr:gamma-glutamyltransferase [Thermomicrobiales bacterium]
MTRTTEAADPALAAAFQQTRSRVIANGGMVATGHPLATAAGIDALRRGGNAMDAAIAAALTTAVVIPAMNGLGGDAFFIHSDGKTGKLTAVNGSGIAPRALSRDYFVSRGYQKMPFFGPLSPGIPGAVEAYFYAIDNLCRLPAADLFSYGIHYAEHGFPVSVTGSRTMAASASELAKYPTSATVFLRDGEALKPGDLFVQRDLAASLRAVAEGGPDLFYRGDLARRIADAIRDLGGEMTAEDFADHTGDVYEPISTTYRGYTVYQTTLPTQGHIVLEELNIIEHGDVAAMGHNTVDSLHLMIEAKKRAFADRNAYSRDPRFGPTPLGTLISKPFARQRFDSIDPLRASDDTPPGALPEVDSDTTYLCAADADGNMVTFITSLSAGFGSHVVAGDTGIMLNNRVGRGFSLEQGHPNVIEGGKRTMHTLNAFSIAKDGEVIVVGGTPGGDQQPQWNMQIISNLIDHDMDVQAAVAAPRWQSFPGTDPSNLPNPYEVRIESRVDADAIEGLRQRGHPVRVVGPYGAGGAAFLIKRDPRTGVLEGGSDPRSEGLALGI